MTWTRNREDGVSFAEGERETMIRFIEKLRDAAGEDVGEGMGEPYGVLKEATSDDPQPLQPEELEKSD